MSNEKTLSDLEWPRVLAALAQRCVSEAGRRRAAALPLAASREQLLPWLDEAREAREALDRGEPLPIAGARDVEEATARLRVGAPLAPEELRDIAATLGAARSLRRFLTGRHAAAMPALGLACAVDPTLDEVAREITDAFGPDGSLVDHASPRLKELRDEIRACRARITAHLEELLQRHAAVLQDHFYTERDGRYVLPVRSDAHERVHGIVHGTSASGSTLFVEPRGVIPLGNRLRVLDGEARREEDAIYARLSGLLHEKLPSVLGAIEALTLADLRAAGARLGADAGFSLIPAADEPVIELRQARHPLLALGKSTVVASDLTLTAGRALIVSGPNAGGKTVALKAMGLAALMLRAGLPVACAPGSRVGFFDEVLTDVGDEQSLHRDLSTFSAHVTSLARMIEQARRGVLILLDEIATGTDPREGEALAAAVLETLCTAGAAVPTTRGSRPWRSATPASRTPRWALIWRR
jgi:DNA mismatch repair protein MutS2